MKENNKENTDIENENIKEDINEYVISLLSKEKDPIKRKQIDILADMAMLSVDNDVDADEFMKFLQKDIKKNKRK